MLHDISMTIAGDMIVWPGDPPPVLTRVCSLENGDSCNLTKLQTGVHAGTHIDAPAHFIKDGLYTDSIPLDTLLGPCIVIELLDVDVIQKKDLLQFDIENNSRVLLKTTNSETRLRKSYFENDFVALTLDAAEYLTEKKTQLIGLDYLSIESDTSSESPVHNLLLSKGIVILEGINLSGIKHGRYELLCLPLKLYMCEGAPARAVLRDLP